MSSLYKIEGELLELRDLLETEDEFAEDSAEKEIIESQLAIKQEELAAKIEGYLHVISQTEAQADMGMKEIIRIEQFAERKKHIAERLKGALLQALLLFGEEDKKGIKRLEIGTHRLSTRRSQSVNISDEQSITPDCKLFDITFQNLTPDITNFLASRIKDLPESAGKKALSEAFKPKLKLSKTLIKKKLESLEEDEVLDWAELETKYSLTVK